MSTQAISASGKHHVRDMSAEAWHHVGWCTFWLVAAMNVAESALEHTRRITLPIGMAISGLVEGAGLLASGISSRSGILIPIAISALIGLLFVLFGTRARNGSEKAYLAGMLAYTVDTLFVVGIFLVDLRASLLHSMPVDSDYWWILGVHAAVFVLLQRGWIACSRLHGSGYFK